MNTVGPCPQPQVGVRQEQRRLRCRVISACVIGTHACLWEHRRGTYHAGYGEGWGSEGGPVWAKPEMTVYGLLGAAPGGVSRLAGQGVTWGLLGF